MTRERGEAASCVFRGPINEVDAVSRKLRAAGVAVEVVSTIVPAIVGGSLVIAEVFVRDRERAVADRVMRVSATSE